MNITNQDNNTISSVFLIQNFTQGIARKIQESGDLERIESF